MSDAEELIFNDFDDAEVYIREDDDDGGISLEDSEDSDLCADDCQVCLSPDDRENSGQHSKDKSRLNKEDELKVIYMSRFIKAVNEDLQEKIRVTGKTRDELTKCQDRITDLEKERDQIFQLIKLADDEEDVPNGDRLRAQHERAILELDMEKGIEESIKKKLVEAEYALSLAELEKGKYSLKDHELKQAIAQLKDQKHEDYLMRKEKMDTALKASHRSRVKAETDGQHASKEAERRQRKAVSDALQAKEKVSKYVQQTMDEIRQHNKQETDRSSAEMNRRINAVLSLKQNITINKENIDALRARKKDIDIQAEEQDKVFMETVTANGGDAEMALLVKKRIEAMDFQKLEYEKKRRAGEVMIAEKLVTEEERYKRRKDMYPHLWQEKDWEKSLRVKPHKKKKLRTLAADITSGDEYNEYVSKLSSFPMGNAESDLPKQAGNDSSADNTPRKLSSPETPKSKVTSVADNLAKPEFEGMWNRFERYIVPKEAVVDLIKEPKASKMEQDIMREKMKTQRENIVQTQVAAGREFKGKASYNCKPEIAHFKDFDVGKAYKQRISLTNVSYSINFCKLAGLSDQLKDFIDIQFDPPGQMSAGMTCDIFVTFKPMINEDLEGTINFLSQTGPFSLPVRCTTKKCNLKVDTTEINFGSSVIGETLRQHITLSNDGALGTRLIFGKYTGKEHRVITAGTADFAVREETPVSDGVPASLGTYNSADRVSKQGSNPSLGAADPDEMKDEAPQERHESDLESSVGADLSDTHDLDLDGMMVSETNATYIAPFTKVKLEVIWKPTVPGKCDAQFIISFEDKASEHITVTGSGTAVDVPVYVEKDSIDLQICMYDRLYQDSIDVKNRATSALKLTFEVPKELRKHMELLPKTGFVQAQSSFSAQLKFFPKNSLFEDAPHYLDIATGVLEVPLTIRVADQTRAVEVMVHAIITNSDLEFSTTQIDFGHCTIHESVKTTIKLKNRSILPQEFGFMGLPEFVDVQPNDGFGVVLPEETIDLDVIFSPPRAKIYSFELCCKSLINREFWIKCSGIGVHTPLELSDQVIHFKATSLNDWSLKDMYVINNHLSSNEYTHPVPRIGKGPISPVGPTSYEFRVPKGSPLTVYPSVGTVKPGEKQRIQIRFAPVIAEECIKQEAVRLSVKKGEERAKKEWEERMRRQREEEEAQAVLASIGANAGKKKQAKPSGKASPKAGRARPGTGAAGEMTGPQPVPVPSLESIKLDSDEYSSAHSNLLRQYAGDFQTYTIPCYIASGVCSKPGQLNYSVHNTMYLQVHCPSVKPHVVVISDNGRMTINYGDISIGQQMNKTITIQNISDKEIPLTGSLLDTTGPFEMRNPLRELPADASHSLIVRFAPQDSSVYQETLHIYGPDSVLHVNLRGRGVSPTIQLNLESRVFDMGAVLVDEYVERTFKIKNTSSLSVDYTIKFDSLSPLRHHKMQELPEFVLLDGRKPHVIGTQNFNGRCVFDCVPYTGTIPGGETQEITLTFAPDHASDYYSDGVHVELFGMEEAYSFQVIGQAKEHIMYVTGGETLKPSVESLLPTPLVEPDEDTKPIAGTILLMFYSVARDGVFSTTSADLVIGCVRTMAVSQKKNGDYAFDNTNSINAKGFTIAEPKSYLEAGTKKAITINWTPLEHQNPDDPVEASIIITTNCEIRENYLVLLRGLIVSQPQANVTSEPLVVEDLEQPDILLDKA